MTSEQPALADDPSAGKTGRFGALRRLRSSRGAAAPTADVTAPEEVPAVPVATAPEPAAEPAPVATPAPAPAVAAAPYEPPAKPSFAERAALRRRAKTLRAGVMPASWSSAPSCSTSAASATRRAAR